MSAADWAWLAVAGVLSGAAASLGIGGGSVLIIILTLIFSTAQTAAQGINLLFFIPVALLSVIIYCRKGLIEFKTVLYIALPGIIGVMAGVPLASAIGDTLLRKLFGAALIFISIKELFSRVQTKDR